jgi:thymidylate kinase
MIIASLDGTDGCVKTTVSNLVLNLLREKYPRFKIVKTALPSTMITGTLTGILRNSADIISPEVFALVYAADHLHHWREFMQSLPKDSIIMQERSLLSTYIYQGLIGKMDLKWLKQINKYCENRPDITIILRLPIETLVMRKFGESGYDIFEKREHVQKQVNVYYNLPEELKKEFNVVMVDGEGTPQEIAQRCFDVIQKTIEVKGI